MIKCSVKLDSRIDLIIHLMGKLSQHQLQSYSTSCHSTSYNRDQNVLHYTTLYARSTLNENIFRHLTLV